MIRGLGTAVPDGAALQPSAVASITGHTLARNVSMGFLFLVMD